ICCCDGGPDPATLGGWDAESIYQNTVAKTRGGPDVAPITLVAITTCIFFRSQSGGACLASASIDAVSARNSPAAIVPYFAIPAATTANCSVVGSHTRVIIA